MFKNLVEINCRPRPFEFYTGKEMWADEHTSERMLGYHLDTSNDISSRNGQFIDRSVEWIASRFDVCDKTRIADFGCGPGLYTTRLARRKADVTGIDFSKRSIHYAQGVAAREKLSISYVNEDYLEFETNKRFHLILMIMWDYCSLSPNQRKTLLRKFHSSLEPGGSILLDVYSLNDFEQREEYTKYEENLNNGLWSPHKYYGFLSTFKYQREKLLLDKYTLIEEHRTRVVYNWSQFFSPEYLEKELVECGFVLDGLTSDVTGSKFKANSKEFAIVAIKV